MVVIGVDGDELRPVVEMQGEVDITWIDAHDGTELGTGPTPVLRTAGVRRVGMLVHTGDVPAFEAVTTLNLGFSRDDDYGRLSPDQAFEHEPQPVTSVAGLGLLSGLVRFCAGRTPLSGRLDLRGLAALENVECYRTELEAVDLDGCTSLVRLVVEDSLLTVLDLQPVRRTLQDLRAAIMRSDSLTFAPLDGPMEALYHYCVREQAVRSHIPHSQLPVVEEYWTWATGQTTCDAPTSPRLTSYLARENPLDQSSVDAVLTALDELVDEEGRVDLSGGAADGTQAATPSAPGESSAAALLARGWRVSTN